MKQKGAMEVTYPDILALWVESEGPVNSEMDSQTPNKLQAELLNPERPSSSGSVTYYINSTSQRELRRKVKQGQALALNTWSFAFIKEFLDEPSRSTLTHDSTDIIFHRQMITL